MLDIKFIRNHGEQFDFAMQQRGETISSNDILVLDSNIRHSKSLLQELQNKRNLIAKEIGALKAQKLAVTPELFRTAEEVKSKIPEIEAALIAQETKLTDTMAQIPNIPEPDVPFGKDETANIIVKTVGELTKFDFVPQAHFELGESLNQMHFEEASQLAGSRFVVLKHDLALLERALSNFMLDQNIEQFGYTEVSPPYLVNENTMFNTGQLPKFCGDSFKTHDGLRLIPTSEVPLTNLAAHKIFDLTQLPVRLTASTPCFRSEAGSAGRDTRGMLRQHQFHKVELVSITTPENSADELERMTSVAEAVLQKLGLPYRVMLLCSQDMGFAAKKTYDIEVWLPGQNSYREISSCSNCGDFQARRMQARYRDTSKQLQHVHTLNGSSLAIGRTMIAIMENYQYENGDIAIPEVLQPYMYHKKIIKIAK